MDELEDDVKAGGPASLESEDAEAEKERLNLEVKIDRPSACERHMTVTIPREDIERYLNDAYSELMPSAAVPGFRAGRAPRKLVEHRFRKDVLDQIKGSLLMDSMAQISEEQELTPISEPSFDLEAIEIPEDGPMTYEFDLEVRPEFTLPEWKGLTIERPKRELTEKDVDERLQQFLGRLGQVVPFDGPASAGDYVTANITCKHDGQEVASRRDALLKVEPELSFRDGKLENFGQLMAGVKAGETRSAKLQLMGDAPNEALRGQTVDVDFEVLEVKKLNLPELNSQFLNEMGGFESVDALRELIRRDLERQQEYHGQQRARAQVSAALTEAANWDLPPGLLRRQSARELERAVLELRRNGFSDAEIRAHENQLRQNSAASTAKALKEHFILERIAEDQEIDAEPSDYDAEIALIASQSGESMRRVRAQLEKRGLMDSLRNQIVERKVIDVVLAAAKFKDVPFQRPTPAPEAIDMAAGGGEQEAVATEADES